MRLAFMGTPAFAVPALDALVAAGHELVAVYTQPPRAAHRGRVTESAVHARARALGIPVRTPERLRDPPEPEAFRALALDAAVVAAYGLILPRTLLEAPRHGAFNIHASLLPRWRGAAPIQRAILAGDVETGVSIMQMAPGLDTGPVRAREPVAMGRRTAGELSEVLAGVGARLIVAVLADLEAYPAEPQDEARATYAPKIGKAEARVDWRWPAGELERLVRALNPAPGAWFEADGRRVKLWAADVVDGTGEPGTLLGPSCVACGAKALRLGTVQPEGRQAMAAEAWWRGARLAVGTRLP